MTDMLCDECPVRDDAIYRSAAGNDWAEIEAARIGCVSLPKGHLLMPDQRECAYLYTIIEGWAYSYSLLADGRRQILTYHTNGDLLTIPTLTCSGVKASVRCLTEVRACQFDAEKMRQILQASPRINKGLFEYLGEQKRQCDFRLVELGALTAEEAIAALILSITRRVRRSGVESDEIQFPLRLAEIADTVGITEVHAGRIVRSLEKKGAIARRDSASMFVDEAYLQEVAREAEPVLFPA